MKEELAEVGKFYDVVVEFITNYSFQIIGAMIIMIIGVVASKYAQKIILKLLKDKLDITLSSFVANFVRFLVLAIMAMIALGKLGISIAPFIAALGAFSLTAGLALQGSISNFAAGVVLIITKPFKIGDTITVHEVYGEVLDIRLAYTMLVNEDKEEITIPNKYMIGDVLVNSFEYRVVEGRVGVAYDSDVEKSIELIKNILQDFENVSAENEAIVGVEEFADSSVTIGYRYWAKSANYFKTQYSVNLQVLKNLQQAEIEIPFPQREIKILGENNVL